MNKVLVLAAAALAFSAVSASAQVYVTPGYEYVYSTPVLDLAVPAYGYYGHAWPAYGSAVVRRTSLRVAYDYAPAYECGLWNEYCHKPWYWNRGYWGPFGH
jgi:hypothetical protein